MRIGVYNIALNEEQFAERWAKSAVDADVRLIADTGSTDNTKQVLLDNGVEVHDISVRPWRFDRARDASVVLLPKDLDVIIALDMDEVLRPGWRDALERAWTPETTRFRYPYIWSWTADGRPDKTYYGDKITGRHSHRWCHPVHEIMQPVVPEVVTFCHDLHIEHYPDLTKSRGQYYPLLELSVKEDPEDDRNAHYLGREYFFIGEYEKAIAELNRHLALPRALWDQERGFSLSYISKSYKALDDQHNAIRYALRAVAEVPTSRELWHDLGLLYMGYQDWHGVVYAAQQCLNIVFRDNTSYLNDRCAWGEGPYDLLGIGHFYLGNKEEAKKNFLQALQLAPNDERIQANLAFCD